MSGARLVASWITSISASPTDTAPALPSAMMRSRMTWRFSSLAAMMRLLLAVSGSMLTRSEGIASRPSDCWRCLTSAWSRGASSRACAVSSAITCSPIAGLNGVCSSLATSCSIARVSSGLAATNRVFEPGSVSTSGCWLCLISALRSAYRLSMSARIVWAIRSTLPLVTSTIFTSACS